MSKHSKLLFIGIKLYIFGINIYFFIAFTLQHQFIYTAMQWRLGVARIIQVPISLLSHRLNASKHFSANLLVIQNYIRLLNPTDCFGGEFFALDPNNNLQILSKPFLFLSHQVVFTRTHIPLANALYHQCLQRKKTQALFYLPLHHWSST